MYMYFGLIMDPDMLKFITECHSEEHLTQGMMGLLVF